MMLVVVMFTIELDAARLGISRVERLLTPGTVGQEWKRNRMQSDVLNLGALAVRMSEFAAIQLLATMFDTRWQTRKAVDHAQ